MIVLDKKSKLVLIVLPHSCHGDNDPPTSVRDWLHVVFLTEIHHRGEHGHSYGDIEQEQEQVFVGGLHREQEDPEPRHVLYEAEEPEDPHHLEGNIILMFIILSS